MGTSPLLDGEAHGQSPASLIRMSRNPGSDHIRNRIAILRLPARGTVAANESANIVSTAGRHRLQAVEWSVEFCRSRASPLRIHRRAIGSDLKKIGHVPELFK